MGAAIQKQVTRDFGPLWQIDATVDVFARLEDVPLGYWHLILRDDIASDAAGVHWHDDTHQPYALVRWGPNWSLAASHEVLEMLADPFGNRMTAGDSPKPGQGRVSFLVEVCDPCQAASFGYASNGILVSDFCTPAFYGPSGTSGAHYSFTGSIKLPHQPVEGGYLTWLYSQASQLWQALVEDANIRFSEVGPASALACLRRAADEATSGFRRAAQTKPIRPGLSLARGVGSTEEKTQPVDRPDGAATWRLAQSLRQQILRKTGKATLSVDSTAAPSDRI